MSSSPSAASPQEAVNPADTIDTVEVTAHREAMRKAIHTFVASVTRFDGENVARWRYPICPSVTGIAQAIASGTRISTRASRRTSLPSSW
jgi:hypothetical protein